MLVGHSHHCCWLAGNGCQELVEHTCAYLSRVLGDGNPNGWDGNPNPSCVSSGDYQFKSNFEVPPVLSVPKEFVLANFHCVGGGDLWGWGGRGLGCSRWIPGRPEEMAGFAPFDLGWAAAVQPTKTEKNCPKKKQKQTEMPRAERESQMHV